MHLKKKFVEKYLCWFIHEEPYIPYKTMLEMIVGLIFISNNIHEVVDGNSYCYRSMVMNAMRINHCYSSENLCGDGEPNLDAGRSFELLRDFDESL